MKQTQLAKLIEQMVQEVLAESASDSQKAFNRFQELKKKYSLPFWIIEQTNPKVLQAIFDLRNESVDKSDFSKKVGPGEYDNVKGVYRRTNPYSLRSEDVVKLWNMKDDTKSATEIALLKKEYDELKDRFEYKIVRDKADAVYGRHTTVVVDKLTGETVSSTVNRQGNLGT